MEIKGKVWGKTSPIFCKNNVEIHRLEGKKGGYSSLHCHRAKFNRFFVESGKIKVIITKDYGSGILDDVTIIGPGEQTTVPPGDFHSFEVLEDCVAYEIYWVELDPDDIERETVGGRKGSGEDSQGQSGVRTREQETRKRIPQITKKTQTASEGF